MSSKSFALPLLVATGFMLLTAFAFAQAPSIVWFDQPATHFTRSLPLGNGRMGAMIFGGVNVERIVLNESSVWSGSPQDADRSDAHEALPEIRRLLLEGKNHEAETLVNQYFTCQGPGSGHGSGANVPFGCYQVLGNLHLRFAGAEALAAPRCTSGHRAPAAEEGITIKPPEPGADVVRYRRALDVATATARVEYERKGIRFQREVLMTGALNDGRGGSGVTYAARLRALARGGSVQGFAQGAPDPALAKLYFDFGRYLLISSSRPGGLPANLQGLWAEEVQTPWNGDWHLDINVQMNYWPAEVCQLSGLHEPLHRLIASRVEPGRKSARSYYNARGWVAHVITICVVLPRQSDRGTETQLAGHWAGASTCGRASGTATARTSS